MAWLAQSKVIVARRGWKQVIGNARWHLLFPSKQQHRTFNSPLRITSCTAKVSAVKAMRYLMRKVGRLDEVTYPTRLVGHQIDWLRRRKTGDPSQYPEMKWTSISKYLKILKTWKLQVKCNLVNSSFSCRGLKALPSMTFMKEMPPDSSTFGSVHRGLSKQTSLSIIEQLFIRDILMHIFDSSVFQRN